MTQPKRTRSCPLKRLSSAMPSHCHLDKWHQPRWPKWLQCHDWAWSQTKVSQVLSRDNLTTILGFPQLILKLHILHVLKMYRSNILYGFPSAAQCIKHLVNFHSISPGKQRKNSILKPLVPKGKIYQKQVPNLLHDRMEQYIQYMHTCTQ